METANADRTQLEKKVESLERKLADLERRVPEDRVSIVVFSGELDRVLAAFVIATGAIALGQQVSLFFTFWGFSALRKKKIASGKNFYEKMMSMMSPSGSKSLPVSKMNFFGIGARMLRQMMKDKKVESLEDMMKLAEDSGARIVACEMSRELMGISDEEILGSVEHGGVATFLADALRSRVTLFI